MPKFTSALKGRNPATESDSLIAQAAQAVETQTSTDPAVINDNAQFEAEIERLKQKTEDQNTDNPDQLNPNPEPTEPTEPTNKDSGNADGNGDGEGSNPSEDPPKTADSDDKAVEEDAVEKATEDALADDSEGGDLQAAADTSAEDEEKRVAVEAFHVVLDHYKHMLNTHETGRIGAVHIGLCSASMNRVGRTQQLETPALSLESSDGVLARVAEFIRSLIAKVKAAIASMYNWLRDFFRGYKAATGTYEKNVQGMRDRLKYLDGKGITVTDEMIHGKKVKAAGLSNYYGGEVKDVLAGASDLIKFCQTVTTSFNTEKAAGAMRTNLKMIERIAGMDPQSRSANVPAMPLSAELLFGKVGTLSTIGNSAFVRDNVKFGDNSSNPGVYIGGLIGGYEYNWTLEANDGIIDMVDRAERLRAVDFRQTRTVNDNFELEALTPAKIEMVSELADALVKAAEGLVDNVGASAKWADQLKNDSTKTMEFVANQAKSNVISEKESFIFASLAAMSPDVYSRVAINPLAKLTAHLHATADALLNWCVQSTKAIEEALK